MKKMATFFILFLGAAKILTAQWTCYSNTNVCVVTQIIQHLLHIHVQLYIENDHLFNHFLHTSVFESAQYTWLSAHQLRQLRRNVAYV